jgi:transcriptional regulator with GAF, ATPase, and Fis domain
MVYKSFEMKKILSSLDDVSQSNATVLVLGESGVGKELVAKAIHKKSQRAGKPFIKVSCAALPEQLLESELFGHEKGSFTGAVGMRKGRFEIANGGTLFLDEIGEISQSIQIKLLRVIQELEFERVGGTKTIKCDTRIIAATNRDLAEEVKNANFREDLFYRLNVISIKVPPLRERVEDTVPLAYHFLEKYRKETNKDISDISDEALVIMSGYKWPGNIRELENVIERAVVLSKNKTIEVSDLPENMRSPRFKLYIPPHYESADMLPLKLAKAKWEKSYLGNALKRHAGNISRTAEAIEIARKNLQEKIKQHDIDVASYLSKNHD